MSPRNRTFSDSMDDLDCRAVAGRRDRAGFADAFPGTSAFELSFSAMNTCLRRRCL